MNYDDVVPMSITRLELVKRSIAEEFSRLQLQQGKVTIVEDAVTRRLRVTATWKVAAQKAQDTVRVPADWWEAFKERWFSKWMLQRWPARHIEWRAYRILPAVDLPSTRLEHSYFDFVREYGDDLQVRRTDQL